MKWMLSALLLVFVVVMAACQSDQEIEFARYYSSGKAAYQSHCQNCHGVDGAGLGNLIPPLTDSAYLKKNKGSLTCLIYNGITQPVMVNQKIYTQKMPPSGLAPVELAEVITFVTNSFGNKQGAYTTDQANKALAACN